ncbi:MAG: TauD/TfdA family dioxygenase [Gammaproteobacteria bacterium]|jgi:taurine dioxygenase|nr:TauD/TfdA family dioxygenase [Gammaproteobacteria bacterium]|tara:strand:+ start:52 stop:942 length:891 start_codon:yes stop_codon:yes gene_type:complete
MNIRKHWQINRLAGSLGAEIIGPDLSHPTKDDIAALKALLLEHMVIFLPDQHPTVDEHVTLGEQFGELEGHPNLKNAYTPHEKIFELAASHGGIADEWHTDLTFREEPARMSILHMVKCPPTGGDTMWTNLNHAYSELSEPIKSLCDGMTALHDAHPHNHPEQMYIHPVVRVHPVSGKKALYVNEHFTRRLVELNANESEALLPYLTRWVQNPRFTVRYRWTAGTVCMWDNCITQHFVLNDFEGERVIQRVTVMGDKPRGADPKWKPWVRPGPLSAASRHDRQLHLYLKENEGKDS